MRTPEKTTPSPSLAHTSLDDDDRFLRTPPSHDKNAIVSASSSIERVPTPLEACPKSTIEPTGAQAGIVFGHSSCGGRGNLTYDDDEDDDGGNGNQSAEGKRIDDILLSASHSSRSLHALAMLASPRQTRAPPCTPLCGHVDGFRWTTESDKEIVTREERQNPSSNAAPPPPSLMTKRSLWGMPHSDTFGTLAGGLIVPSHADHASAIDDESEEEGEADPACKKEQAFCRSNDYPQQQQQQSRRPSFFSFHLSSSLLRASRLLGARRSSGAAEEDCRNVVESGVDRACS